MVSDYAVTVPQDRQNELLNACNEFKKLFGIDVDFFVRTPGRVNLIGEHIDYSGYGVLPMAIDKEIVLAVSLRDDCVLDLHNTSHIYQTIKLNIWDNENKDLLDIGKIYINGASPKWHDYFLAGYKGGLIRLKKILPKIKHFGFNVLLFSNLPACSGLSSSSALVCASTLMVLYGNAICLDRMEMAELCAKNEQYIGTEGGGMDQAICFLSKKNQATLINFDPVRVEAVKLPKDCVFVVCNSLVPMDKGNTPHYNIRVCECLIAAQILYVKEMQVREGGDDCVDKVDWRHIKNISHVQSLLRVRKLKQLAQMFEQHLHKEPYTQSEIREILDIETDQDYNKSCLHGKNIPNDQEFKLLPRAVHVSLEAQRVLDFKDICNRISSSTTSHSNGHHPDTFHSIEIRLLGETMNASHESCKMLFECSHPRLDELVGLCRENGALGSRLTGAGWGGCCVSLVPKHIVSTFVNDIIHSGFYQNDELMAAHEKELDDASPDKWKKYLSENVVFATEPSSGACVYK